MKWVIETNDGEEYITDNRIKIDKDFIQLLATGRKRTVKEVKVGFLFWKKIKEVVEHDDFVYIVAIIPTTRMKICYQEGSRPKTGGENGK